MDSVDADYHMTQAFQCLIHQGTVSKNAIYVGISMIYTAIEDTLNVRAHVTICLRPDSNFKVTKPNIQERLNLLPEGNIVDQHIFLIKYDKTQPMCYNGSIDVLNQELVDEIFRKVKKIFEYFPECKVHTTLTTKQ
jgi:hypothetical protein